MKFHRIMTTSLVADNEQPRAFDLYLMLSATERMGGVVHDDHRHGLARRFAADNFLRKFSDSDPFWLACDTFTDALPTDMRYFPAEAEHSWHYRFQHAGPYAHPRLDRTGRGPGARPRPPALPAQGPYSAGDPAPRAPMTRAPRKPGVPQVIDR